MSLRTRLVLVTTGLLRGYLENQEDGRLRPAATILSRAPMPPIALDPTLSGQLGSAVSVAVNIFDSPTVVYLDDQGGTVGELYERRADDRSRPRLPDLSSDAVAAREGRPFTVDSIDGDERWRVVAMALDSDESGSAGTSGTAAAATVVVADSMDKVDTTIGRLRSVSLEVGAGLLAVLAVIAWFAVRSGFRPLARIEE
ncbi:MAG: two-component system, OmpR family, sensor kinase, partial [Streptomyces sp.]|nr:two-component system, OmpR family, sensor kinase [Streptomyces sp.]